MVVHSIPPMQVLAKAAFFPWVLRSMACSQSTEAQRLLVLSDMTWHLQLLLTHRFKWSTLSVPASAPWTMFSSFLPFRGCRAVRQGETLLIQLMLSL